MSLSGSDHITADGRTPENAGHKQPAQNPPTAFLKSADDHLDVAAAAEKLNCSPDPDALCTAIDVLIQNTQALQTKVAFFEKLFGYPSEYLMTFHEDELKKLDNIIFMGQQKLEGEALREALVKRTGKEAPPEMVKDRFIIETVREAHYDFAVVLYKGSKEQLDCKIRGEWFCSGAGRKLIFSLEVQETDAKVEAGTKIAKGAGIRGAQDVVMAEDGPLRKDAPVALGEASSQHSVGMVATSDMFSRD